MVRRKPRHCTFQIRRKLKGPSVPNDPDANKNNKIRVDEFKILNEVAVPDPNVATEMRRVRVHWAVHILREDPIHSGHLAYQME